MYIVRNGEYRARKKDAALVNNCDKIAKNI